MNSGSKPLNYSNTPSEDDNIIMLFGCTGTGKTSFANIASGSDLEVGNGLRSSTKLVKRTKAFQVDDKPVIIVDCPGFNDTSMSNIEILEKIAEFLTEIYKLKRKVIGFLYFHNITDTRVGGTSLLNMRLFEAFCGEYALRNAVYVTNMWPDRPVADLFTRENELTIKDQFFKASLEKGARMARHTNTRESAHDIIRMLLGITRVIAKLQRQMVDENIPLVETEAGRLIEDSKAKLRRKQKEMDELKLEKVKALESTNQSAGFHGGRIDTQPLGQQEWEKRMNEENARQIDQIKADNPETHCWPIGIIFTTLSGVLGQFPGFNSGPSELQNSAGIKRTNTPSKSISGDVEAIHDPHHPIRYPGHKTPQGQSPRSISGTPTGRPPHTPPKADYHPRNHSAPLPSPFQSPRSKGDERPRRDTTIGVLNYQPKNRDGAYSQTTRDNCHRARSLSPTRQGSKRYPPQNVTIMRFNEPVNCGLSYPPKAVGGSTHSRTYSLPSSRTLRTAEAVRPRRTTDNALRSQ